MTYRIEFAGADRTLQREAVLLLGRVFPDYRGQIAAKNAGFPFEELSFIARAENGRLCGHLGIMPFSVSDGNGGIVRFAGVASVAVDPEFRGLGIAAALCEEAVARTRQNQFDALPLFTGKPGVYEHHGWNPYTINPPRRIVADGHSVKAFRRVPAVALSDLEKESVRCFYDWSSDFPGKVLRTMGDAFHSWKRIFREPGFEFLLSDAGYAVSCDGAIIELCTVPGEETAFLSSSDYRTLTLALFAGHPAWHRLTQNGVENMEKSADVYHGEMVMIRPLLKPVPPGLYFSCTDKF